MAVLSGPLLAIGTAGTRGRGNTGGGVVGSGNDPKSSKTFFRAPAALPVVRLGHGSGSSAICSVQARKARARQPCVLDLPARDTIIHRLRSLESPSLREALPICIHAVVIFGGAITAATKAAPENAPRRHHVMGRNAAATGRAIGRTPQCLQIHSTTATKSGSKIFVSAHTIYGKRTDRPEGQEAEYWERARALVGMEEHPHFGDLPNPATVPGADPSRTEIVEEASIQENLGEFPSRLSDQGDRPSTPSRKARKSVAG